MSESCRLTETITAVMMRIMIPVASPRRYAPTTVAAFEVDLPSSFSCSGADVGLGCGSGVQETNSGCSLTVNRYHCTGTGCSVLKHADQS